MSGVLTLCRNKKWKKKESNQRSTYFLRYFFLFLVIENYKNYSQTRFKTMVIISVSKNQKYVFHTDYSHGTFQINRRKLQLISVILITSSCKLSKIWKLNFYNIIYFCINEHDFFILLYKHSTILMQYIFSKYFLKHSIEFKKKTSLQ